MQFTKSTITLQALLLAVLVVGTQAQFLSDATSVLGGIGPTIESGASSLFGEATSALGTGTSGAASIATSLASGASSIASSAASGASSVATAASSGASSVASDASSSAASATSSRASNAAMGSSVNGLPVNMVAAVLTVLLGSAIAGTLVL
ncbi:uncharacterized protein UBRO_00127 [Ustilago bromivora]|uniref:Uncharacterized protein n=1 Tax=Ustilago bromivora TaxID=307758 RepID=A0A1K0FY74_9BASI|nr:uncharacterized protein UBRO_00127 [Ustilago bromivora]SYW75901.1 uncharacterized protein UBRO2_01056 [Ustilago bromivora]